MYYVYADGGGANPGDKAYYGLVVEDDEHDVPLLKRGGVSYVGKSTNNLAEYAALNEALCWALDNVQGHSEVTIMMDSQLVVKQVNGEYDVNSDKLKTRYLYAKKAINELNMRGISVTLKWIPRTENKADQLVQDNR